MSTPLKAVELNERQRHLVNACFGTKGGSGTEFLTISGHDDYHQIELTQAAFHAAAESSDSTVELPLDGWRIVYDVVHASMYSFGPFEVPIVLGSSLVELADVNLRICIDAWGAYGGLTWEERH